MLKLMSLAAISLDARGLIALAASPWRRRGGLTCARVRREGGGWGPFGLGAPREDAVPTGVRGGLSSHVARARRVPRSALARLPAPASATIAPTATCSFMADSLISHRFGSSCKCGSANLCFIPYYCSCMCAFVLRTTKVVGITPVGIAMAATPRRMTLPPAGISTSRDVSGGPQLLGGSQATGIALVGARELDAEEVQLARRAIDAKSNVAELLLERRSSLRHRGAAAAAATAAADAAVPERVVANPATRRPDHSDPRTLWDALSPSGKDARPPAELPLGHQPDSINALELLRVLNLHACTALSLLPPMGALRSLEELDLSHCIPARAAARAGCWPRDPAPRGLPFIPSAVRMTSARPNGAVIDEKWLHSGPHDQVRHIV